MPQSPFPEHVSIREAAAAYGRDESTVRRWIRRGTLPALRIGGRTVVPLDSLSAAVTPWTPQAER